MFRRVLLSMILCLMVVGLLALPTVGAQSPTGQELTYKEKKEMLTEVAIEHGIPPEILKAIAYNENAMNQFNDGEPAIAPDGGIGMMQITIPQEELDRRGWDLDRIKYDTRYNIEIGAQWLKERWQWGFLPSVNDKDPRKLEHWYFAIMAYNGLSFVNDLERSPTIPYQTRVYDVISNNSLISPYKVTEFETNYNNGMLTFNGTRDNYVWPQAITYSTQMFQPGDQVTTRAFPATLRQGPSTRHNHLGLIEPYTTLEIVSGPHEVDIEDDHANHYVFYEVKGGQYHGYTASSNLQDQQQQLSIPNTPLPTNHRANIARTAILTDDVPMLRKQDDGTFVEIRTFDQGEGIRTFGVDGYYYHIGGNDYIKNEPRKLSVMIGRLFIKEETIIYEKNSNGEMTKFRTANQEEALRTFSYTQDYYHVGGNNYVKNDPSKVEFFKGYATILEDTTLYHPDGTFKRTVKQGEVYRISDIDRLQLKLEDGSYILNTRGVVRYIIG
ncbi:transglycosylase SLT domain-containing protein [Bacillus sp. FJAT-45037]|uniref:transglycosylase SLT domain-containing protein n=1 Tax=Bacillus sp. FJAT-45037 TaxID=2011007 RepID=UPI000C23A9AD|nr:transglycosylase SLT domain-containing protein [Bacillus sp. FJAT-45037]